MYLLTAIFNKSALTDVLQDLYDRQIEGITVSEVIGKGGLGFKNGSTDLDPKIRIDIVVSNDRFKESAKEAIRSNTQEVGHGSGKIWVTPVLEVERVRTGETNEAALTQSHIKKQKTQESYFDVIDTPAS